MTGRYEDRIVRVIEHIHANPAGDLSLDALADVAAMSRFHWHRVFRAMTGETAAEAVRRVRMHRATFWLIAGDPVADVARRVGYPSARSFARAFAELQGMTPSAFRERGQSLSPLTLISKGQTIMFDITIRPEPPAPPFRSGTSRTLRGHRAQLREAERGHVSAQPMVRGAGHGRRLLR